MGLDTIEEREVIHHVDTVFGILLTIVVFQSNLILGFVKEIITPWPDVETIPIALLVTTAVSLWLVAVLKQSWLGKMIAWGLTFFLLLWDLSVLVARALYWNEDVPQGRGPCQKSSEKPPEQGNGELPQDFNTDSVGLQCGHTSVQDN